MNLPNIEDKDLAIVGLVAVAIVALFVGATEIPALVIAAVAGFVTGRTKP